jgi:thiol-disulfide isomerase/thioredoxin
MITRRAAIVAASSGILFGIDTREPAGRFKAKTLDGETFDNASVAGKVVLIQFWATWCQYCKSDEPAVEKMTREFADRGLIVPAVDVGESKKKVKQYLQNSGVC